MEQSFIQLLATNYSKIFNFGGNVTPMGGFSIALQYALRGYTYNALQHEAVVKQLKMPQPLGSVMHGYGNDPVLVDKIAARFIIEGNVEQSVKDIHRKINILKAHKFSSGYNLNYSALFLQDEAHAARAKQFFNEMKSNQWFLTRKTDYPIAVILTKQPHDPKQLAETVYKYYEALKVELKSGDQLQMLAQFLTSYSPNFEPKLVEYTLHIKKYLQEQNVKVPRSVYPSLGLLALNATTEETLQYMLALRKEILKDKKFELRPELALMGVVLKSLTDEFTAGALTAEMPLDWVDLMLYSDVLLVLPKTIIEGVLSADFNFFN